jgi:hypothetical protein
MGKHSIAKSFTSDDGNIWFERIKHTGMATNASICGANRRDYDRAAGLETHAYALIHTDNIKTRLAEIFGGNMQFDVIIDGQNEPPYSSGLWRRFGRGVRRTALQATTARASFASLCHYGRSRKTRCGRHTHGFHGNRGIVLGLTSCCTKSTTSPVMRSRSSTA